MASGIVGIGPTWLGRRQMGFKNPLGTKTYIYEQMYSNILPYDNWDHTVNNTYTSVHGGVFCLEFSPEGSLLVAACEKKSIIMFDPLTHKRIHSVENAHLDCVNCVKFLDSRSFATCSDDFTVALWDARNLNQKVKSLKGHSNWVKNIEYSPEDGLLVTSGFDGSILTWELNTYRESGPVYSKVFSTNGLMRMRLTPDATKMIICTTGGYLIVVHNLNLNTLGQDLDGFKPNMYRLMQLSQTVLPIASGFTDLFRGQGKRNRVEFITDFPDGDDAEVVSSLQIHPDGHCAVSRNVSNNEKSEWSCIHNIEERLSSDESDATDDDADESAGAGLGCRFITWPSGTSASISTTPSYIIQHSVVGNARLPGARSDGQSHDLSVSPSDVWEALVAIQEARIRRESENVAASEASVGHMFRRRAPDLETRSRPPTVDNQIFVARIMPDLNQMRRPGSGYSGTSPFRRNVATSTCEATNDNVTRRCHWTHLRNGNTKKNGRPKQAQGSLYRRSLVGLYDRTSSRRDFLKHGRLWRRNKLNTNYEMNETRRLRDTPANGAGPSCVANSHPLPAGPVDHEEVVETESRGPSSSSSSTADGSGRTVLMGVFRPGDGNGVRSTTMRKHNVAAVTVSSSPEAEDRLSNTWQKSHRGENTKRQKTGTTGGGAFGEDVKRKFGNDDRRRNATGKNDCLSQRISKTSPNKKIHQNTKRLTHYVEEPNLGRGFIKELCVSPDGRIICSPFGNGIRLLSFSPTVQDVLHCYPSTPPIPLHELTLNIAHADIVVSTKFSPHHNLLVSGCLSGKIVYYQPFF